MWVVERVHLAYGHELGFHVACRGTAETRDGESIGTRRLTPKTLPSFLFGVVFFAPFFFFIFPNHSYNDTGVITPKYVCLYNIMVKTFKPRCSFGASIGTQELFPSTPGHRPDDPNHTQTAQSHQISVGAHVPPCNPHCNPILSGQFIGVP